MASCLFDLPTELRSLIFSSFSLRDISRLRQCCSVWKNNLQDLSFMKVLDFSYSPDIAETDFNYLFHHRINKHQNNISSIIIAHTRNMTVSWLEVLLQVLPRIKTIRISHSLDTDCIPIILQQEHLESISFKYTEGKPTYKFPRTLPVKCTKLIRFKIRTKNLHETLISVCDFKTVLKMFQMNPALKNDVNFLEYAVWEIAGAEIANGSKVLTTDGDDLTPIVDAFFALNDLRLYKHALEYRGTLKENYGLQMLHRTFELMRAMSEEQLQSNRIAHENPIDKVCFNLVGSYNIPLSLNEENKLVVKNVSWLRSIANMYKPQGEVILDRWLEKTKKRPFHSAARESYILCRLNRLSNLASKPHLYRDALFSAIEAISTAMKRIPRRLRLLKASWLLRTEEFHDAFEEYMGIIDPNVALYESDINTGDRNAQGYTGAYHVAKDYLKSPELLQRLKALNPNNFDLIESILSNVQPKFDAGKCTNEQHESEFLKQYWYACYSCFGSESKGLCYSCVKTCHNGQDHQVAYVHTKDCYCECLQCNQIFSDSDL